MIIDRHNYEEYFILYWDNELTVSQKEAVENFVKENTDLQEEFKLLGDTRFTPDSNIQFNEKDFLLNDSFINVTNYEEQLLNYIDDEVTADQRKDVEKFAGLYPAALKELALLQKTKLQPESEIVFPDKSTLYRREEKVRVISMTWFRVAVAAAIILIAGFATLKLVNTSKNNGAGEVVKVTPGNSKPTTIPSSVDQAKKDNSPITDVAGTNDKKTPLQPVIDKKDEKSIVEKTENTIAVYRPENKNNLPSERKNIVQQLNDPDKTNSDIYAAADLPHFEKDTRSAQTNQPDVVNAADLAKQDVTLKANPTLYIPEQEEKEGGGIKEFLRKTTRVFERRTKINTTTDDNKLLVGAFAVSLK